jgi:hypothetical protein
MAIGINGVVYSRGPNGYFKGSLTRYLRANTREAWWDPIANRSRGMYRDAIGLRLKLSSGEKETILAELERRVAANTAYGILGNSCSTNVAEVLEMVGIAARDPRYLPTPVTPAELLRMLERSDRLVESRLYPKGYQGGASANW